MKIATEEAKKVYKNSEKKNRKTPSRDELNGLEYIVGALKESLRLYSVVPVVTRKCLGDDYLGEVVRPERHDGYHFRPRCPSQRRFVGKRANV